MYTVPMHRWFPEKNVPVLFMFAKGEETGFGDEWEKGIYYGPTPWDFSQSKVIQSLDGARKLPKDCYMRK